MRSLGGSQIFVSGRERKLRLAAPQQSAPSRARMIGLREHERGGDAGQAFDFFVKAAPMVKIHGVRGLVHEDCQGFRPEGIGPDAVLFERQRQLVLGAPVRLKRQGSDGRASPKRDMAGDRNFRVRDCVDQMLAKPDREGNAQIDAGLAAPALDPGPARIMSVEHRIERHTLGGCQFGARSQA